MQRRHHSEPQMHPNSKKNSFRKNNLELILNLDGNLAVFVLDSYHSFIEGDTSADVAQFRASLLRMDACPGPLPVLIPVPAEAEKEDPSHTENEPPVLTKNCQQTNNTHCSDYRERGRMSE